MFNRRLESSFDLGNSGCNTFRNAVGSSSAATSGCESSTCSSSVVPLRGCPPRNANRAGISRLRSGKYSAHVRKMVSGKLRALVVAFEQDVGIRQAAHDLLRLTQQPHRAVKIVFPI